MFYGTFDPVTNGHLWLVARSLALDLFDRIVIGVVNDPARNTLFTAEERLELWRQNGEAINRRRIEVVAIEGDYPVRAARRLGCHFLLRGIRTVQEYQEEVSVQRVNHDVEPMVQAVYLMADPMYANIFGGVVRDMIGTPGWSEEVKRYVPVATWEALMCKFCQARLPRAGEEDGGGPATIRPPVRIS